MPQLQTVESGNNDMIGQYEIRELLGEGGIGQVHHPPGWLGLGASRDPA